MASLPVVVPQNTIRPPMASDGDRLAEQRRPDVVDDEVDATPAGERRAPPPGCRRAGGRARGGSRPRSALATFAGPPAVVITVAPRASSSVSSAQDTPEPAPLTSTVSPSTKPTGLERVERGHPGHRQRGRVDERHRVGQHDAVVGGRGDELGEAAGPGGADRAQRLAVRRQTRTCTGRTPRRCSPDRSSPAPRAAVRRRRAGRRRARPPRRRRPSRRCAAGRSRAPPVRRAAAGRAGSARRRAPRRPPRRRRAPGRARPRRRRPPRRRSRAGPGPSRALSSPARSPCRRCRTARPRASASHDSVNVGAPWGNTPSAT